MEEKEENFYKLNGRSKYKEDYKMKLGILFCRILGVTKYHCHQ